MDTLVFIILIFNISLDAFVIMMEKGATILKLDWFKAIRHSAIFAVINTFMFYIGHWFASKIFTDQLEKINQVTLIIIFLVIGIIMILRTFHEAPFEEKLNTHFNFSESIKIAILSGLDCLFMGFGCYYIDIATIYQYSIVFITTLLVVYGAFYLGYYCGAAYQKYLHYLCGSIYIIIAMILIVRLI